MNKKHLQEWAYKILDTPIWVWVLLGIGISYCFYFIGPVFLNSKHVMQFFQYIAIYNPIGNDLHLTTKFSSVFFLEHRTPYIGMNSYPPLTMVLYFPFIFLQPEQAYKIITSINLFCFVCIAFLLPFRLNRKQINLILIFFITGIISYGFQFELERGQYNVIAIFICMTSLFIFHYRPKLRWLAYLLFSISVQLKVYPAIYIFFLVDNWSDWKAIIRRFTILFSVNLAALFVLGPAIAVDFYHGITDPFLSTMYWNGNHSINSFVVSALPDWFNKLHFGTWLPENNSFAVIFFFLIVGLCFLSALWLVYRNKLTGFNPYFFLISTLLALVIPSVSHDYKLSILPGVMAVFMAGITLEGNLIQKGFSVLLVFIISILYGSTLFSLTNKPNILQSNFPALLCMIIGVTVLFVIQKGKNVPSMA